MRHGLSPSRCPDGVRPRQRRLTLCLRECGGLDLGNPFTRINGRRG